MSPIATRRTHRPRLSGVAWLVWRQHRAAYWTVLAAKFVQAGFGLGFIPVLLGAVSPARWLAAKLGVSALVIVVCTVALSAQYGWWWEPASRR
ncbi:hypothetical protein [Streptomyces sp. NBC_00055]|uniref:hypothetical protein n=1 Tax=Streptomyces sp. NBC_00055 TaxID=2975632 RepID=UPI003246DDC4